MCWLSSSSSSSVCIVAAVGLRFFRRPVCTLLACVIPACMEGAALLMVKHRVRCAGVRAVRRDEHAHVAPRRWAAAVQRVRPAPLPRNGPQRQEETRERLAAGGRLMFLPLLGYLRHRAAATKQPMCSTSTLHPKAPPSSIKQPLVAVEAIFLAKHVMFPWHAASVDAKSCGRGCPQPATKVFCSAQTPPRLQQSRAHALGLCSLPACIFPRGVACHESETPAWAPSIIVQSVSGH